MKTGRDELEGRLTTMFQRQAESVPVPTRTWSEVDDTRVVSVRPTRKPRFALTGVALVSVVVAVVLAAGTDPSQRVKTDAPAGEAPDPTTATSAPADAPFHVETNQVSLSAAAVLIEAGGKSFVTAAPITVHGDPGTRNDYTTLELTWHEHGVEMRLNIYFTSDGREWWSDKIWTYDGKAEGKWIMYEGDYFRSPLGTPFSGDLDISASAGRLHISKMQLEAFRRPAACANATGPYALEPDASRVEMGGAVSVGGGMRTGYAMNVALLDTASCALVEDQDSYRYEWRAQDPTLLTVKGTGRRGEFTAATEGTTSVVVTVKDPHSGAMVTETSIEVVVVGQRARNSVASAHSRVVHRYAHADEPVSFDTGSDLHLYGRAGEI